MIQGFGNKEGGKHIEIKGAVAVPALGQVRKLRGGKQYFGTNTSNLWSRKSGEYAIRSTIFCLQNWEV